MFAGKRDLNDTTLILKKFKPIYLTEIKGASVFDRVDTKFIFHRKLLNGILEKVLGHARILEIDGHRSMTYKNQYYDTENQHFYNDHHNGKLNRIKIRVRQYVDSDTTYLEIKRKHKGRIQKKRKKIATFETNLSDASLTFIKKTIGKRGALYPQLQNSFERITLVTEHGLERMTFDMNLNSWNHLNDASFDDLVIAEIKQARLDRSSPFFQVLKKNRVYPNRFSKYCLGLTQLQKSIKANFFKEKIIKINKITAT